MTLKEVPSPWSMSGDEVPTNYNTGKVCLQLCDNCATTRGFLQESNLHFGHSVFHGQTLWFMEQG